MPFSFKPWSKREMELFIAGTGLSQESADRVVAEMRAAEAENQPYDENLAIEELSREEQLAWEQYMTARDEVSKILGGLPPLQELAIHRLDAYRVAE